MLKSSAHRHHWTSKTAIVTLSSLSLQLVAPLILSVPASAQSRFTDVPANYWAERFIQDLAARDIIAGFPDGSFHPNDPVTRAQYAAMVRKAFNQANIRGSVTFVDVPQGYWAEPAIQQAYTMGFMTGYPGNVFKPNQNIPRAQVLVSLANGLNYTPTSTSVLQVYNDASAIPNYAVNSIAAATEKKMVVNYPNVNFLNPNQTATRADVAAFIYQALASQGKVATINSSYIVGASAQPTRASIPAGTSIPVSYAKAEKIVVLPTETVPLTLTVAQNLVSSSGQVVIPQNSQVVGELRPAGSGSQFVAKEVILSSGQKLPINAQSQTVTKTETVRKGLNPKIIVAGAVVGAGAAAAIEGYTGQRTVNASEVLAGSAAGAALATLVSRYVGRRQSFEVITIDPNADLTLTLSSDLTLPAQ